LRLNFDITLISL